MATEINMGNLILKMGKDKEKEQYIMKMIKKNMNAFIKMEKKKEKKSDFMKMEIINMN